MKTLTPTREQIKELLVEYPSRKAFFEMISSAEYIDAHRYREEGLEDSVLLAGTTLLQA